jgi:hypothetical protein
MNILNVAKLRKEHAKLARARKRNEEDEERLVALAKLFDQIWDGATALISEDDFEAFAEQETETVNGIDCSHWPFDCIDWTKAADALKQDYKPIEFDGETYWYHA